MKNAKDAWNRFPIAARVAMILVFLAVAFAYVNRPDEEKAQSSQVAKTTPTATVTKKNVGERVFASRLDAYTKSDDGRVLVRFDAWTMTKDSVEGDIRRFMREMAKESDWTTVTLSALAEARDDYGNRRDVVVLTYTFSHDEAMRVADWNRANLAVVGTREFVVEKLR